MLLLSFPIDSPINIVIEQKVMKMNARWFWKWMMPTAAGIQAPMHMDGLGEVRVPSTWTAGCVPTGLATRTPGTKDDRTQCWVHVCTHVSRWGGAVHGKKHSSPESMVDTHSPHSSIQSKILHSFLLYHCFSPPLSVCSQWLGFSL